MKRQKLFRHRIPWWTWDCGYDLPPNKGIWKKIGNKITRAIGKRFTMSEYKESFPIVSDKS